MIYGVAKYSVKQQHKYFYPHQQYNAFILGQDEVSGMEIADWMLQKGWVYVILRIGRFIRLAVLKSG